MVTLAMVGLYVVGDAFAKIDDFAEHSASAGQMLGRLGWVYLLRMPTIIAEFIPMTLLVGAAYAVAQLSRRKELTAMKASGMSIHRVFTPIIVTAVLFSFLGTANRELAVPRLEAKLLPLERQWKGEADETITIHGFIEEKGEQYKASYDPTLRELKDVWISRKLGDEPLVTIQAKSGVWKPAESRWLLKKVQVWTEGGKSELLDEKPWRCERAPDEIIFDALDLRLRPLGSLLEAVQRKPENVRYRFAFYSRLTYPVSGIVLLFLGVPFLLGHEAVHRSRVLGVGVALLICLGFYAVHFLCAKLGNDAQLHPAVAAWLPIVIFGGLGLYLFDKMPT